MSRWKLYDNWDADLSGLTIEQLVERRAFADQRQRQAETQGLGRNPKAARDWRNKRQAVDEELRRRGA
jgi:hypothetical protein